jgi:hypothetical protein
MPKAGTRRRTRRGAPRQSVMPSPRRASQPADRASEELHAHYSECRALGHDWQHIGTPEHAGGAPAQGVYAFASRCRHCSTERVKWFTRSGLSAGGRYRYADGYQSRGEGKLERGDWGKLFIRSHLGTV